jgi:predicted ATPase
VLFQKYLYDELDPAEKAYLHEDVAVALEELFGEQSEEIAAQLGRHFEESGTIEKALHYRALAGQRAVRMTANREAIAHYRKAIGLVATLPSSPDRDGVELDLQIAINLPLTMIEGWAAPGIRGATSKALGLADKLGLDPRVLPAYWFLSSYFAATGKMSKAIEQADRMVGVAQDLDDELQEAMGHWCAGLYRGLAGEIVLAREHLDKTEEFYEPEAHSFLALLYGIDPGVATKVHLGWILAYLGFIEQSRNKCEEAIALARSLGHPHTICFAIGIAAVSDWRRKDWDSMRSHSEESLELAAKHSFVHLTGFGLCLKGLAIANQGGPREGIAAIQSGIELLDQTGTLLNKATTIEALASAYALAGDLEMALATAEEGLAGAEETGELKYQMTTPILKGSFLFEAGDHEAAEKLLLRGLKLARNAEVKLFELEAATGLARLWMQQGKRDDARELLASVYGWFTQGFDEVPLKEARAVLDELS